MKISVLIENTTYKKDILAEHGLSLFIETDNCKILFDAGQTDALIKNAETMNISLADIDYVVISHGHFDHTGGLPQFCRINKKAEVYIHRDSFGDFYGEDKDGLSDGLKTGILWTERETEETRDRLSYTAGPYWINDDMVISGTIPDTIRAEQTEKFLVKKDKDKYIKDNMDHEQILVLKEKEKLYIFSGCSHTGVIAAVNYAKYFFPETEIKLFAAGMHLFNSSSDERKKIFRNLFEENIDYILPFHCTGSMAIFELKNYLEDKCKILNAGDCIDV